MTKPTPKPGELWDTDRVAGVAIKTEDGWRWPSGGSPLGEVRVNPCGDGGPVGYTVEYVKQLRDRLRAERDEAIARAEAAEAALVNVWLAGDLPTITEREPWSVLRAAAAVIPECDSAYPSYRPTLRALADRLEREHAETAKRDRLTEQLESATREAVETVAGAFMHAGIIDDAGREALVSFDYTEAIGAMVASLRPSYQ